MSTLQTPNIESLQSLLDDAARLSSRSKEVTFFSIGGRGYFENPCSDLLAFFMADHNHGLHHLFLGSFLQCMGIPLKTCEHMTNSVIRIKREDRTDEGNKIDLTIHGKDWILVIENKIRHWVANPLDDYVVHAEKIRGARDAHYAILSPSGVSPEPEIWKPVAYREFVDVVKNRLNCLSEGDVQSKWRVIAQEFVLHLDQEISQTRMTEEEIRFVEKNIEHFEKVDNLFCGYSNMVEAELLECLQTARGTDLKLHSKSWGCEVAFKDKTWQYGLGYPLRGGSGACVFKVFLWCKLGERDATEERARHFSGFEPTGEEDGLLTFEAGFGSRTEAIAELCRLAKQLSCPTAPMA